MSPNARPTVSVIVPSYNHRLFVGGALESVLAQTYDPIEVVVVDDASTDGTPELVAETFATARWRARFGDRCRLIVNSNNQGAHAAINAGLAAARGSYLSVLNSDDAYSPARIETLMNALQRGAHLALSAVRFVDETNRDVGASHPLAIALAEKQRKIGLRPTLGFALLDSNIAISSGNLLFSRWLLERIGPFRPLLLCHDWDFAVRALVDTEPVWVPEPLYEYRLHSENTSKNLAHVAATESNAIMHEYVRRVAGARTLNHLAPSPSNWPGLFEVVMRRRGYWDPL